MQFRLSDTDTTRKVTYKFTAGEPKWKIRQPGSYAKGFEWMADEVWTVRRAIFTFHRAAGQWVLNMTELRLELAEDGPPGRSGTARVQLNSQTGDNLPWWMMKMAASAAQEVL